jgi:hypothetical protein
MVHPPLELKSPRIIPVGSVLSQNLENYQKRNGSEREIQARHKRGEEQEVPQTTEKERFGNC